MAWYVEAPSALLSQMASALKPKSRQAGLKKLRAVIPGLEAGAGAEPGAPPRPGAAGKAAGQPREGRAGSRRAPAKRR